QIVGAPPGGGYRRPRGSRLRNFNWETLPQDRVVGRQNIWTASLGESDRSAVHIDTSSMEELFGRREQPKNLSVRKSFRVSILDSKRSMNISIFLKQFKRPVQDILEDIKQGASAAYGAEKLIELQKLLPDKEEVCSPTCAGPYDLIPEQWARLPLGWEWNGGGNREWGWNRGGNVTEVADLCGR
uniref:FH2 domain-containing protein n=1 Tax=Callorhinchus milii TaxID=7868 RepID=A0A4W3HR44_CALMI